MSVKPGKGENAKLNKVGVVSEDEAIRAHLSVINEAKKRRSLVEVATSEIEKCRRNFWYFCETYAYIQDRNGRTSLFKPNAEQIALIMAMEENLRVVNVKARKLGMSTVLVMYGLWLALFHRQKCGTIAHDKGSVRNIFSKARFAYLRLPRWMKMGDYAAKEESISHIEFNGGGSYRTQTDRQEKFRGGDLYFLHLSELAKYQNPLKVFNSALDAMLAHGVSCIETTARGMGFLHTMWLDESSPWRKIFYNWFAEPTYSLKMSDKRVKRALDNADPKDLADLEHYSVSWRLAEGQKHFALVKLAEKNWSWKDFHQEWPASADLAFSFSEGRVFKISYDVGKPDSGVQIFEDPLDSEVYTAGVDCSSGSDTGDYQTLCILKQGRNSKPPVVVLTAYVRVESPLFAELIFGLCQRYSALVVVESNTYGLEIINRLKEAGYENLWRRVTYNRMGNGLTETIGYNTNVATRPVLVGKMKEFFGGTAPLVKTACKRMQREINDFIYNRETQREEHAPGCHDDLLFAFALAAVALDEDNITQHKGNSNKRPKSEIDILLWEMRNDRDFDPTEDFDDDSPDRVYLNGAMQVPKEDDWDKDMPSEIIDTYF